MSMRTAGCLYWSGPADHSDQYGVDGRGGGGDGSLGVGSANIFRS